ncbi:MAG: DUF4282 domain-containing protein [Hyphomonadaceae bacterium]|nr:DUF4282 domain-containing protein [Hyphomonadaceae bacterium]GIK50315.1 MAG: hypothetical protein BroJett013_30120 [Alphaproteobacteria bacterium]
MTPLVQRMLSFEHLLGPSLVRIVYYVGAAIIVLAGAGALLTAIFTLAGGNIGGGFVQLIAAPAVCAAAFVYWRFMCELFMLAFLAYERLGEIRNLLAGASAPDPDYPQF